jgi:hypothetical protein
MPRYYFHVEDDETALDQEGVDLRDIEAARREALCATGDMLRNGTGSSVWIGKTWRMWTTDHPGGRGRTFFTLQLSATQD